MSERISPPTPRMALMVLGAALGLAAVPPAARGQESTSDFPTSLSGASGNEGVKILHLETRLGFTPLARGLTYFIDPALKDPRTRLFSPPEDAAAEAPAAGGGELKPLEKSDFLRPLIEVSRGSRGILVPIKQVTEDFLKLISQRDPVSWMDLRDFLDNSDRLREKKDQLWVTLSFRFWSRSGPTGEDLQCRLDLRAFKTKIEPGDDRGAPNLTRCEMVFEDAAVGTVPIRMFKVPEEAVRAAIINALRNRIAVNFCLNPALQLEEDQRTGRVLGMSIDQVQG